MALAKLIYENGVDAFVHPENTVPTPKIQGPNVGPSSLDDITSFFQIPRIVVPAGVTDVIYEPAYARLRGGDASSVRAAEFRADAGRVDARVARERDEQALGAHPV